ncbi:elongator complex protein 1-like [Paramacrobiotus metropolitanus]|uniref:elongator complex protein 1-like n=1 Tax=Paramacrobiotus metropolitanus TaxID=2943436 RepID=UPI00244658AE|nr:elongator complex protein 1-like [Paramacrobiotus metropolitanus]
MRNLEFVSERHRSLPFGTVSEHAGDNQSKFLCSDTTGAVAAASNSGYVFIRNEEETVFGIPPEHSHIVDIDYLVAEAALFIATVEGTIALSWGNDVSVMCHIAEGVSACKWSADQEVLALTTRHTHGGPHLIVMTADWLAVSTSPMESEEFGEQMPVTVGWGKKETQFHGSEGKEAAKAKTQITGGIMGEDDAIPRISWRGDGQYFAVGSISELRRSRLIRVYDRQGVLQSTSEPVNGLEWCLAWKPSGALIASSIYESDQRHIQFFEKNGLRHGEFALPFPAQQSAVKDLQWNSTSEILLVWIVLNEPTGLCDCLQLWTVNNYHWYAKQTLRYPRTGADQIAAARWSQHEPYVLYILDSGSLSTVEWTWSCCRSEDSSSTVAVIDGTRVLLTNFASGIVPPPSSSHFLTLDSFINQVAFYSTHDFYELAVVTDKKSVSIFYSSRLDPTAAPILRKTCVIPFANYPRIFWFGPQVLAVVEPANQNGVPLWGLWVFSVKHESQMELESLSSMEFLEADKTCRLLAYFDAPILNCIPRGDFFVVATCNGVIFKLMDNLTGAVVSKLFRFPLPCDRVEIVSEEELFGLHSASKRLYRKEDLISDSCTSFIVDHNFLLYTTHHHKLTSIRRGIEKFGALRDEREVERGSRLVTVVSDRTDVILQLPRGNLETIHPRALVIFRICQALNQKNYALGFELARRHRVDMNLLVDYNVNTFLNDVQLFVEQLNDSANMNIFIAELNNDNVTSTTYAAHFAQASPSVSNKVNTVLDRLEKIIGSQPLGKMFISLLACDIYKKPSQLETALFRVKDLRGASQPYISAEEALKFILYSADVNELFNIALGTYDLELVLMVAGKSRKDPKEYIPFLNQFRILQPEARQFLEIDKHLKRYSKALKHLARLGPEYFEEFVDIMTRHNLYKDALQIFPEQSSERSRILFLYGEYLNKQKRRAFEAGVAYEEGQFFEEAVDSYRKSLDWQLAMSCAHRAGWETERLSKLAQQLALQLQSNSRHAEAGNLLLRFSNNSVQATETFLAGRCWDDLLLLIASGQNVKEDTFPRLKLTAEKCHADFLHEIEEIKTSLKKYSSRLVVVRQMKQDKKDSGEDYVDTASETSSISDHSRGSKLSKLSKSSSKSKRKDEKKKRSLREGGSYEELALLDTIRSLYNQANVMMKDIESLLKISVLIGLSNAAKNLFQQFDSLVQELAAKRSVVWSVQSLLNVTGVRPGGYAYGPNATSNMIAADMQNSSVSDGQIGNLSLSDLVLFIPPELNNVSKWNECKMDQLDD